MRKLSTLILVLVMSLSLTIPAFAQGDSDGESDNENRQSIAEIVVSAANAPAGEQEFTILLEALVTAGLAEGLAEDGPFTVFAPTDAAFERFFATSGLTPDELLNDTEILTAVLAYHVLPGTLRAEDLARTRDTTVMTILPQASVIFSTTPAGAFVDDARVVRPDILATNGVVHVIDTVLTPAAGEGAAYSPLNGENTIGDFIVALALNEQTTQFGVLLAAARSAGVVDLLLVPDAGYTLFAPTDAAFVQLLQQLGVTADELLNNQELLGMVLAYHLVPAPFTSENFFALENAALGTFLDSQFLRVRTEGESVFINQARVIAEDIVGSNGVVHVINGVLLPQNAPGEPMQRRGEGNRNRDGRGR